MRGSLVLASILLSGLAVAPNASAATTLVQAFEGELAMGLEATNPNRVHGNCDVYANCQELRGISLHDYDITAAVEGATDPQAEKLRLTAMDKTVQGTMTTTFRACWYDGDFKRLGCGQQGKGHFQKEFTLDARHVRFMVLTGAGVDYQAWLWTVSPA